MRSNFFSATAMTVVGLLLLSAIALTVHELWEVALRRWFG